MSAASCMLIPAIFFALDFSSETRDGAHGFYPARQHQLPPLPVEGALRYLIRDMANPLTVLHSLAMQSARKIEPLDTRDLQSFGDATKHLHIIRRSAASRTIERFMRAHSAHIHLVRHSFQSRRVKVYFGSGHADRTDYP